MLALSLVPILLYLVVLRAFDAFSLVRWRTMAMWMAWGTASALLMLAIVKICSTTGHRWAAPWVSPVLEEILKALPLLFFVCRRKVVFTAETQLYGESIGGGFALIENIIYLEHFPNMDIATALVRGLGTGLLHMGCTALAVTIVLVCYQRFKVITVALIPLLLIPSISIHTLHNVSSISPMTFMVGMIVVFFLAFYIIYRIGEQSVINWLDVSMGDDISLIASLREGKLAETKAGEYLTQLRDRFDPLVFFDMCVYVQLYLELLIEAKARVMLHDAGIEMEETSEQKTKRKARLTELDALTRRIPHFGLQLLRPLIHATDKDQWVLQRK